jgi:hypothetical protein
MRVFAPRVEVVSLSGEFVRAVHRELAAALVEAGVAEVAHQNGRVRSVRLLECADTCAERIGEPEGTCRGVKFVHREMLEASGARVWAHHRRAVDYGLTGRGGDRKSIQTSLVDRLADFMSEPGG